MGRTSGCVAAVAAMVTAAWPALAAEVTNGVGVAMTEWRDPLGRPPTIYEAPAPAGPFVVVDAPLPKGVAVPRAADATARGRVAVVVDDGIYTAISAKLNRYVTDLQADGYTVVTYRVVSGSATDLRAYLRGLYNEASSLKGAVFIGNLPYIIYEYMTDTYHNWPCDLFFMDLDGTWTDTTENGDVHAGNGKYDTWSYSNLDIWVCRWKTDNLSDLGAETTVLNNYFDKDHAFRQHALASDRTALNYADDDWGGDTISSYQSWVYGGANCTSVSDDEATTASDYKGNRLPQRWDLIHVSSHGSPNGHGFQEASGFHWVYTADYRTIDPPALFYNLFVCSSSDYLAANNLGSTVAFNAQSGLLAIGSTKAGSMIFPEYFYDALAGGVCFGDAFVRWFNKDQSVWGSSEHFSWHAGMVMLGDAALRPSPKMFVLGVTTPRVVQETAGTLTGAGRVNIPYPLEANLTVSLASSDTSELTVPATATVLAGQTSVVFNVTAVNDGVSDFVQEVTVSASAAGWTTGSDTTRVEDDTYANAGNALQLGIFQNDWVGVPSSASLKPTAALTVESWVYEDSWTASLSFHRVILSCTESGGYALALDNGAPNRIRGAVYVNGAYLEPQCTVTGLAGGWHHLALTCDGRYAKLYVDGVLRDTRDAGATHAIAYDADNSLILGDEATGGTTPTGNRCFDGMLDEIRIWSAARTETELRDNMHRGVAPAAANLQAYYRCNAATGGLLLDSTANANDGALHSSSWAASGLPYAAGIVSRTNIRASWIGQTTALPSGRLIVADGGVSGTNFVAVGHDNAAETQNATDKPATAQWRLNRSWQADTTPGQIADLRFDVTGWTNNFSLLTDADGVFANATVTAGTRSSNTVTFAGVAVQDGYRYTVASVAPPAVTTAAVSNQTETTARCGGQVTSQGTAPVTARGVCWNAAGNPTVADSHTTDGSGAGAFTSTLTGLLSGQPYYVRAYATSAGGTSYGQPIQFMPRTPAPGKALVFAGDDDYVSIPDAADLDLTSTYTLECWFKADTFGAAGVLRGLMSKYQTSSANGWFVRFSGTELQFDGLATTGLNLQTGVWHHVAAVNAAGTRRLYVNGAERTLTGTPQTMAANSDPVRLGSDFGGRYFDGQIDEVRIWNTARTVDNVRDNMHKVLTGGEAGLVAYYLCDSGFGATAPDTTGRGHAGTLVNGPLWTASTVPCADLIADRANLRGYWQSVTNSLASGRLTLRGPATADGVFAVFGHDNAAETQNATDKPANADWRLNRAWRAELGGAPTAELAFDTSGLTGPFALLADADGVFANAAPVSGISAGSTFRVPSVTLADGRYYTLARVDAPAVTTAPVSNITHAAAQGGGTVTAAGGSAVTARGLVWGRTDSPTLEACEGSAAAGSGTGAFACAMTGLAANTRYTVRAYATNDRGTGYGDAASFLALMVPPGNALAFDGGDDYVTVPSSSFLKPTNLLTVCAWVYRSGWTVGGSKSVVSCDENGGYSLGIYDNVGGNDWVIGRVRINNKYIEPTYDATQLAPGWHHLALAYNGRYAFLYVDGQYRAARHDYADYPIQYDADNSLILGADAGGGTGPSGGHCAGTLDEVSIWNVALGEAEIRDQMHHQLAGSEAGLAAYYRMNNESGGLTLRDFTGHGNDGTLVNGPAWVSSTMPCAVLTADRTNLRGVWPAKTASLASGRLTLSAAALTGADFAVFGHDGAVETTNTTDKPATATWRLNRAWRADASGAPVANFAFDTTGLAGPFALLVDADGAFANATQVSGVTEGSTFSSLGVTVAAGSYYTVAHADVPVVTTASLRDVLVASATGGGTVTGTGGSPVTERGIVWDTAGNPSLAAYLGRVSSGSGTGTYSCAMSGLSPYTTYYVRAYATNSQGVGYGNLVSFATRMTAPGYCLDFDGTDDKVGSFNAVVPAITRELTLEAWVRLDNATRDCGVLSRSSTATRTKGYGLGVIGGKLVAEAWNADLRRYVLTNGTVTAGQWTHLALTYKQGDALVAYVNGVEAGRTNVADRPINPAWDSINIGVGPDSFSRYLDGRIDETRVWTVAHTVEQLRDNMHRPLSGNEPGLASCYCFDRTSGDTVPELVPGSTSYGNLYNMANNDWVAAAWPAAQQIDRDEGLRAVWVARPASHGSSILSVSNSTVTGTACAFAGHNGGTLSARYTDKPYDCAWRLDRAWRTEANGVSNGVLRFDCTGLGTLVADAPYLRLLSDTDSTFADAAIGAGQYANGVFTVTNRSLALGNWYTLAGYRHGPYYVDASRPDDSGLAMTWATAKRTLQAAVDEAGWGETVYVTNGLYREGGRALAGTYTNRVVIDKDVRVVSVNGPAQTFIVGESAAGGNGTGAVRCVWMSNGTLSGFTVTNGHTRTTGDWGAYQRGGGVFLDAGGTVSNCVIAGNAANVTGGGVDFHYGGTVVDCTIENNTSAFGGGGVSLHRGALLDRCIVRNNAARKDGSPDGGGLYFYSGGTARNCLIAGNTAEDRGGGAFVRSGATNATLENCTVVNNTGGYGGGVYFTAGTNRNNIIYFNRGLMASTNWAASGALARFEYCNLTPTNGLAAYGGTGCTAAEPQFAGPADYRLLAGSPGVNAGDNRTWMPVALDLDRQPRVRVGTVDMGAYEYVWAARGNALTLGGTNGCASIPDSARLDFTVNYTLEAWFEADTFGWLRGLVDKYQTPAANGWLLRLTPTSPYTGLSFDELQTATGLLESNRWYHVAAVNSNGIRRLWLNGVECPLSGTALTVKANTDPVRIGSDYGSRYFDGCIDEVRIWNVVRSEAQIRDAMHKALNGDEAGLVGYYRFDCVGGTRLPDLTANRNDGTLQGDAGWTASTAPLADAIAGRANLRGAWFARVDPLASSLLSVSNAVVAGTDYRVFGHDGGALAGATADKPACLRWRLGRFWEEEGVGDVTGDLKFDCAGIAGLIGNPANLRLVIRAPGDTFANATVTPGVLANNMFTVPGHSLLSGAGYTLGEQGDPVTITASAGPHGAIAPAGNVTVPYGSSTNFAILPDSYWHVNDVTANGASVGAVTAFAWSNVTADGAIEASFSADVAAQGTPHWWLAQCGLTNGGRTFDQAETDNPDGDPFTSLEEWVCDTDPTNPASYFRIGATTNLPPFTLYFRASSNRWYTLHGCSNLTQGLWSNVPGAGPRPGAGGADWMQDTNQPPMGPFYRLRVRVP